MRNRRLSEATEVRRWDRYGFVVDSSTHYATVEWDTGEFEEVDQLDSSIEVVDTLNPLEKHEDLECDKEEWDVDGDDEEEAQEAAVMRSAIQNEIDNLAEALWEQEERAERYQRHLAEEGHRARSAAVAAADAVEHREAA